MKSSSLAIWLSVLSLAGLGVLYVKVDNLTDEVRPLTRGRVARSHDVPAAESDADRRLDRPASPSRAATSDSGRVPGTRVETVEDRAKPLSLEERVARLERKESEPKPLEMPLPGGRMVRMRGFARSVDDLARTLKLSSAQKDRVASIVERAKDRIDRILKIPDDEGRSPHERRQEQRKKLEEAIKSGNPGNVVGLAMNHMAHRNKKIPGTNATYGEEIDRVKNETRDEIANELSPEQREAFEDTRIDPMLGESNAMSVAFVATSSDGGGEDAEVIVEGGTVLEPDPEPVPREEDE